MQKSKKNKDIKPQKVNFSTVVTICKAFLKGLCPEENVIFLISKNLLPDRPGRSFELNLKPKSCTYFCYRSASVNDIGNSTIQTVR